MRFVMIMMVVLSSITISHSQWLAIEDGLEGTTITDNDVWVFKIDQNKHSFYVRGSNTNPAPLTEWAEYAAGGINLNMFKGGYLPNGYTRLDGKVIQPDVANYNSFIVWNSDTLMILDRTIDSMKEIMSWPNISQNIRMIKEDGKRNRWQVDQKKWSVSVLATTTDGDVLMIHSRHPYTMHEFIDIILAEKQLKVYRMVYLEGGPESSLAMYGHFSRPLRKGQKFQRMGSYETGFNENDDNRTFWPIPWALCFGHK